MKSKLKGLLIKIFSAVEEAQATNLRLFQNISELAK